MRTSSTSRVLAGDEAWAWQAPGRGQPRPGFSAQFLCLGLWVCLAVAAFGQPTNGHEANGKSDRGYAYLHDVVPGVPWSIHILKFELGRADLELQTTLGGGSTMGVGLVSEQVKALPAELGRPIAALNGDYFLSTRECAGDPEGLQIRQGELISAPSEKRSCFWVDAAGNPHVTKVSSAFQVTWPGGIVTPIGLNEERAGDAAVLYTAIKGASTRTASGVDLVLKAQAGSKWLPLAVEQVYTAQVSEVVERGNAPLKPGVMVLSLGPQLLARLPRPAVHDVVRISTLTIPSLKGARTAIGGGPAVVAEGKALRFADTYGRHPRSAVGWNREHFFLVEVDGRQRNLSLGMTLNELATYLVKLGCQEALNLDGGGSATLWVLGNVMNSPSEGRERPSANALVLMHKPKETGEKDLLTRGQ